MKNLSTGTTTDNPTAKRTGSTEQSCKVYATIYPTIQLDWYLYTDMLTCAYITQVHRETGCTRFELVIYKLLSTIALEPIPSAKGRA